LGQVLGPLLVGLLSDWLEPTLGELSIRYAMLATAACAVTAGAAFWAAMRASSSGERLQVPGMGA
jgi:hypothetical protein